MKFKNHQDSSLRLPAVPSNALTFDIEEHFQVHAFEDLVSRSDWERFPSRVVANTRRILAILEEYQTKATFFILGWVADRHPDLVIEIARGGHEVATHGYWHELVYRLSPSEFKADLRRSLRSICLALGGQLPLGHRAPAFSITRESSWALDILRDEGIPYDSSVFPIAFHDRYGVPDAPRYVHEVIEGLCEIPVSTVRLARRNWPVAGGGYFRLYPRCVTKQAIRHLNGSGLPAVVYLHPWEFDPSQPKIRGASYLSQFRHYVNLTNTETKLRHLLSEFQFAPLKDVFAEHLKISADRKSITVRSVDWELHRPAWLAQKRPSRIQETNAIPAG